MSWWLPDRMGTVEERATERSLASESLQTLAVISAVGLLFALLGWGGFLWGTVIGLALFQSVRLRRNKEETP